MSELKEAIRCELNHYLGITVNKNNKVVFDGPREVLIDNLATVCDKYYKPVIKEQLWGFVSEIGELKSRIPIREKVITILRQLISSVEMKIRYEEDDECIFNEDFINFYVDLIIGDK